MITRLGSGSGTFSLPDSNADLPSLLRMPFRHSEEIYADAVQLLNSMKISPSCNRLAATNLILSCQSFGSSEDGHNSEIARSLDNIKSLFAARLAICELLGAGAASPDQCSQIFPSRSTKQSHNFPGNIQYQEEEGIRASYLEKCLKSLGSKPQWWTSYSNARQNAAVMCQAARIDIEREEQIRRYENLADIAFSLTNVLNRSLTGATSETSRNQLFLKSVDSIRHNLVRSLEETVSQSQDVFTKLFGHVESLRGFVATAGSDAKNLERVRI